MATPMSMLGADTGQLEALAQRLAHSAEQIETVRDRTNTTALTAVEALTGSFEGTVVEIQAAMGELQADLTAVHGEMTGTAWTGANAADFNAGFTEFNNAMVTLSDSVSGGYATDLKNRLLAVTADIEEFQGFANTALTQAGVSTESMRAAVHQQAEVLEHAMNGGMSFSATGTSTAT